MDIAVVAVGRLKAGPERELCNRYLERARKTGRRLGFHAFLVKEALESRASRNVDRVAEEEEALRRLIGERGHFVCLDESGDQMTSAEIARMLARDAEASVPVTTFVIGGPDGIGSRLLASAGRRISFGRATLPHQLVRILLAEQLYRAMTILSGHPYHRA